MDSDRGKDLFKFDRSMMERLADNGFPMSQINVQRRMRPTISHHIRYVSLSVRETPSPIFFSRRTILYPKLEDNEVVMSYPDVKGMSENVVFFTHDHKEDGGQESVSKVNSFEVRDCNIGTCGSSKLTSSGKHDRRSGHVFPAPRRIQRSR